MAEQYRLFFALELPAGVKDSLAQTQRRLKASRADVRWVRVESIHLTLKFLGDVEAGRVEELISAAGPAAAACSPLKLRPASAGCFPRLMSPRVVWTGLEGDLEPLGRLAAGLEAALAELGFAPEGRPFSPHLTLGRVKSSRGRVELIEAVRELWDFQGPEFTAKELILFRSQLNPAGAVYTPLRAVPLGQD